MIFATTDDGAVPIHARDLATLRLTHLVSGIDCAAPPSPLSAASALLSGYSEWVSAGKAGVTIGWDWQLHTAGADFAFSRVGTPRHNLMLDDNIVKDVSQHALEQLLCRLVDDYPWQAATQAYLLQRHGVFPPEFGRDSPSFDWCTAPPKV